MTWTCAPNTSAETRAAGVLAARAASTREGDLQREAEELSRTIGPPLFLGRSLEGGRRLKSSRISPLPVISR